MTLPRFATILINIKHRAAAFEQNLTRRTNVLIFLLIRFLLMSAMVVGFAWTSLELSP